ncbi:potassium-transporting ATPase subunit C [Desulfovibrio sp. JC010]|uniref:potassium-transporting ATPase subunit C n=1 Tax=Desulfovibrio sp. JC010 TaxID=2593641 RepID=UPI0013D00B38|nr:potassium-transporting ATPase subunit C [Desulfovibrio sp. JC010]NDV26976.1 potassium-transporting ATPase subunit C [Desulfovibrio sp. JC010]
MTVFLLIFFSVTEIALLVAVIFFFLRLRKSEELVTQLQLKQEEFVKKLQFNTQLENEMMNTFAERQEELAQLDMMLDRKSKKLKKILSQAEEFSRSPQFLRQIILTGHKEGKPVSRLAKATGLSIEEVELIIDQHS